MNKPAIFSLAAVMLLLLSCSNNSFTRQPMPEGHAPTVARNAQIDSGHVRTGFYFLAEGSGGVPKQLENSSDIYFLAKEPFASVDNVSKAELQTAVTGAGDYPELCLTFDEKGTEDWQKERAIRCVLQLRSLLLTGFCT